MFLFRLFIFLTGLSFQAYSMEDGQSRNFIASVKSLPSNRNIRNEDYCVIENRYLAIFDGHGGHKSAEHACSFLYKYIKPLNLSDDNITATYLKLDKEISCLKKGKHEHHSGTTALSVFLDGDNLVVANVGDSRGVLITSDTYFDLTDIHRPSNDDECVRISNYIKNQHVDQKKELIYLSRSLESSPTVVKRLNFSSDELAILASQSLEAEAKPSNLDLEKWTAERVKDKWVLKTGLNITRSLGHPRLKKYGLSGCPSIKRFSLDNNFNIVVLFSDGIGDYLSNQEVASLVRSLIKQGDQLDDIDDIIENLMKQVEHGNDDRSLIIALVDICRK